MIHAVLVILGIHDTSGAWYAFWSGSGSDLGEITLVGALIGAARHKNCHRKGCWRLGHPDSHGHPACRIHHSRAQELG